MKRDNIVYNDTSVSNEPQTDISKFENGYDDLTQEESYQPKSESINDFSGQVAIITGAASGIGLAISKKLLKEDAIVVALDIDEISLEKEFSKSKAKLFSIDITQHALIDDTIKQIINLYGRIDILINSAGIIGITNILSHEVSVEDLNKVFEVNFITSFYTTKAVIPHMLNSGYGRILHIASIAGKEGNAGMLAYSTSKAAIIAMTKVQGKEYAETGITINAIAPSVIKTPLLDNMPANQIKYMTDKIPMKRCGTLEEVSNLATYIVSKQNSFTTGFTFDLSGGRATY